MLILGVKCVTLQSLGQVGRVVRVHPDNDVRVIVNGRKWTFNPKCLVPAPNQVPQEDIHS